MTQEDVVLHWQQGAKDALEMAELGYKAGKYALVLFHCHLAVEKALKAAYIRENDTEAPYSHELIALARLLKRT